MKMASLVLNTPYSFSETGKYFCHCGADGKLKLWDTSTGRLKQEYTKNLHLSSPCTSLLWVQTNQTNASKKPRLSVNAPALPGDQDVIAVGTSSGTLLLYSVSSNSVISEEVVHTSKVNSLTLMKSSIFSCSDDKHISELDVGKHKVKRKWKAGKEGVKCILALRNGKELLSASCIIKLWDLKTQEILKTFVGHSSDVFTLLDVPGKESYFISAARGDRVISAWSTNQGDDCGTSMVSFLLPDSVASVHLGGGASSSSLCAVSESGSLHIFQHKLNGSVSKPLKPKWTVTIASEDKGQKANSSLLRIHSSLIIDSDRVLLAYGNPAVLTFETLFLSELSGVNTVLLRENRKQIATDEFNSKNRVPGTDSVVEYLGVGDATPRYKGKRDVPLERRLDNLAIATPTIDVPKKDNMAQLLLQGLQSKNKELIQDVLFRQEDTVIVSTVKSLPMQSLHPLLKELTSLLQGKTFCSRAAVRWLSAILKTHAAVLLSSSGLIEPLLSIIEGKVSSLPGLLQLKGRLALVAEQLGSGDDGTTDDLAEAIVNYQDRIEDDSDSENATSADSADEWDEFSGMDDSEQD